ncbi:HNH endonuclease [Nonomuraea jabiensis]|uniref:HNH endonuclease n=1 Tax=Nonomuraea jabiensis TaxID=882448 RepID=UPI0034271BDA
MTGKRVRCFYCCDSLGADIDHYTPVKVNFRSTFSWDNWLLVCPPCNRRKASSFPLDSSGVPLLLDPTQRDPWKHFFLDRSTGLIAPRYLEDDSTDPIAESTLEVLECLVDEAIAEGRLRAIRRFTRAVNDFLAHGGDSHHMKRLQQEIAEDDYGVSLWFLAWEGSREQPFADFVHRYPVRRRRLVRYSMKWPNIKSPV